jgi:hypothetical protein
LFPVIFFECGNIHFLVHNRIGSCFRVHIHHVISNGSMPRFLGCFVSEVAEPFIFRNLYLGFLIYGMETNFLRSSSSFYFFFLNLQHGMLSYWA